jgi:hypothetical protein
LAMHIAKSGRQKTSAALPATCVRRIGQHIR